jgi:CubicO group peptidase (beta-lactamase class C family)
VKILLSILFLISFHTAAVCQVSDIEKEIRKIIKYDTEIDHREVPGFSVGIIDGDSTFYLHFGNSEKDSDLLLDTNAVFEIGSSSKVFTSLIIHYMVKEGRLSFDQPVNNLIDPQYKNPRLDDLTLWHLINHYSGFARIPEYFGKYQKNTLDPYAHFSKENLLAYYRDYIPKNKEFSFSYSHTNYALLELIMQRLSGKSYQNLLDEYIFNPLKMNNSFVDFPEDRSITPGYNRAKRKVKPWSFGSFAASEGIKSTIGDMARFIQGHLGLIEGLDSNVLSEQLTIQSETTYNDKIMMANGWHVIDQRKNYNIYTHTGKTAGHNSFVAFVRETNTGVVILSNSSLGTRDLGFLILRMINYNWKRKSHVR